MARTFIRGRGAKHNCVVGIIVGFKYRDKRKRENGVLEKIDLEYLTLQTLVNPNKSCEKMIRC